jgi:hypothetical protein
MDTQIVDSGLSRKSDHSDQSKRDFLITALRCARLRVTLLGHEIDEVGMALKFNMVSPEVAVGWLDEIGALQFINPDVWREIEQQAVA